MSFRPVVLSSPSPGPEPGPGTREDGTKYLHGLIRTPHTQVYVSRGLGTTGLPLRFRCRPEINLLTLAAA